MGTTEKEFDRSVCFSFFEDYFQHVENVEKEFGIEVAYKVIMTIVKYGLYEEEPEDDRMKILVNKTILKSIDLSQKRRSRGFSGEDLEKTQKVMDYYRDHPDASQNEIVKATGISKGKVNKVIRKIKEEELNNSITSSNPSSTSSSSSDSNSNMTVTVTGSTDQTFETETEAKTATEPAKELIGMTEEQIHTTWDMYKKKNKYKEISDVTNLNYDQIKIVIDYGKAHDYRTPLDIKKEQDRAERIIDLSIKNEYERKKYLTDKLTDENKKRLNRFEFNSSKKTTDNMILDAIIGVYDMNLKEKSISDIRKDIVEEFSDQNGWYACDLKSLNRCLDYIETEILT